MSRSFRARWVYFSLFDRVLILIRGKIVVPLDDEESVTQEVRELGNIQKDRPIFINAGNVTMGNTTNHATISGGAVGAFNQSGTQTVDSVTMTIGGLENNRETRDLAAALKALVSAITAATELTDRQRRDILEQVGFISTQAGLPSEARSKALIGPIINSVANVCAGAGGLAAAWQIWGPAIMKFFGL